MVVGLAQLVVREERAGKRKRGTPGFQDRCVQRRFWQRQSLLTEERIGFANSAPKPMCGRGEGAAGVAQVSRFRKSRDIFIRFFAAE